MLRSVVDIFSLGESLAGARDPRLRRGLVQGAVEAVLGAVPYVCLYLLLVDVLRDRVELTRSLSLFAAMFGALALQIVVGVRAMINIMTASYALFGAARLRVAEHIRRLPMGWFTDQRSGALAGVLTTELNLLSEIWSHFLAYLSGGAAIPACLGLFLLAIDWRLGLVMMATLPLAFLLLALALRLMRRLIAGVLAVSEDANHAIVEYVRGIQVLRTFGRFGEGLGRLERALARLRREALRAEVLPAPLLGSYGFAVEAGYAFLVYVAAWMLVAGEIDAETLLLFAVVSMKFYQPLYDLGVSLLLLRFGNQALERTQAVLATGTLPEPARPRRPANFGVAFARVSFAYEGGAPALVDVTVELPERRMTAIVGPSGAGKSTLVQLIARLWDVSSGALKIGGVDVRDMSVAELHRHVAMVFQDVVLFAGTVRDNLRIARPDATDEQLVAAARAAQIHDVVAGLPHSYDTPLGEAGGTLSGGERQRLSIARALLKDAPIVLLDEAMASVDPETEAEIQRAIDELVRDRTVVVIAHRLRMIRRVHQIVVLDRGRVVELGRHEELVARGGLYARLWAEQEGARGWRSRASA